MIYISGFDKPLFQKAVKLFCEKLGIAQPRISIYADDTIVQNGMCYYDSNEFLIFLKSGRENGQTLVTLAHEMVHVKQFLLENLENTMDLSIPYKDRWWEQEAFEKESELAQHLIYTVQNKEI